MLPDRLYDYDNDPMETLNLSNSPRYKLVVESFENEFKNRNVAQVKY